MAISQSTFAQALDKMRPGLVLMARRLRRCHREDAEDLVGQVVLVALEHLADFDEATGDIGLRRWLNAILYRIVQNDFRRDARAPTIAPLEEALHVPSAETSASSTTAESFDFLPPSERQIVTDWLAGYGRVEVGKRRRLHRNTVAHRLHAALDRIRAEHPDFESLELAFALFTICSRRTVYRKPSAAWRPWRDRHPPEHGFHLKEKNSRKRVE
jgi:DNA-directed RNA polymerase specialized sigma24 family protein